MLPDSSRTSRFAAARIVALILSRPRAITSVNSRVGISSRSFAFRSISSNRISWRSLSSRSRISSERFAAAAQQWAIRP